MFKCYNEKTKRAFLESPLYGNLFLYVVDSYFTFYSTFIREESKVKIGAEINQ